MVQTKLSVFCDKIIEAGWLAAAIITPLFFNWYSNRVFEASKVALLRSIALVMLAAWLSKTLEARDWRLEIGNWKMEIGSWNPISNIQYLASRTPLLLPSLLLVATYILTTITSIAPRVSFWGSYERRQGLYVILCYIVIFFSTLETLRTRQQLERLITVILLTSVPVSLYGIMQRYQVDPLVWVRGGATRVESTLGNPILIGAYLIMVVPLTVRQLIRSFSPIRTKEKKAAPSLVLFGYYLLLLLLQLACLVFTQSRGPWMGLMAGALFFFLLWAVLRGRRGLAVAAVGVSIALLLILVILNLPHSPLTIPDGIPYVERLDDISRDIMEDRGLIWYGVVNMVAADRFRTVVGYGPETMGLIFYPYAHPDWADLMNYQHVADRCHNETCDAVVTGGLVGLAAYLFLFSSIFYYGLKWLGLIADSRQRNLLVMAWLGGGSLGALIPWLVTGSLRWTGVGIPAGMLLGLVVYLMISLLEIQSSKLQTPNKVSTGSTRRFGTPNSNFQPPTSNSQFLIIALFSALIAHFVEIQFGIAITATRTYFWLYAALLVIVGRRWQKGALPEAAAESPPPRSSRQRRGRRRRGRTRQVGRLWDRIPAQLSASALSHSLLVGLILATTAFDLITHQFDLRANGPVVFGLLLAIWLLGGITVLTSNSEPQASDLRTYILGSLFCFLPFLAAHGAVVLPGAGVERATAIYYVYIFLVILAVAGALMIGRQTLRLALRLGSGRGSGQASSVGRRALSFGFWILSLLLILNTNLKAAQADIYYKFGLSSEETGEIDKAIVIYQRAIQLAPRWDPYYASLGWAYGLKAITASDAEQRPDLFEKSLETLRRAQQMNPFHPDTLTRLGHVHWNWSRLISDPEQRAEKLETALAYYQQAVTLSPLNHWHQLKETITKTLLHLGATYADLGELSQAAEAYQKAIEKAPDGYEGHKGLASVYLQLGRLDEALEEARMARDLAPEEERAGLDDLIAQIEAQKSW